MLQQECAQAAVRHELTQGAVRMAVRKVRGRVFNHKALKSDQQFAEHFQAFAEKISLITLAPLLDDVSVVHSRDDWREAFATGTMCRLRRHFSTSYAKCYPQNVCLKPPPSLEQFIRQSARAICDAVSDAAPTVAVMSSALWGIVNVTAQVTRFINAGLNPLQLPTWAEHARPIDLPKSMVKRTIQPLNCN